MRGTFSCVLVLLSFILSFDARAAQDEQPLSEASAAQGWKLPSAADDVLVPSPSGSVRMLTSGFLFPAKLGPMPLRKKATLSAKDVMADYSELGGGNGDPWVDIIVFDYGESLDHEFDKAVRAVENDRAAGPVSASPFKSPAAAAQARERWWRGTDDNKNLLTGVVMVERRGWIIEFRASCPNRCTEPGVIKLQAALDAFDWSATTLTTNAR